MSDLVHSSSVTWVVFDRDRTISAGFARMLRAAWQDERIRLETVLVGQLEDATRAVEQSRAGLLWLVIQEDDAAAACRVLLKVRSRWADCLRLVYLPQEASHLHPLLAEAGAQMLVSGIPCCQRLIPSLVGKIPKKTGGYHPLTTGLVDRLAWGDRFSK
ncbi:MAG: hypothetical protein U0892_19025 [Pirellulales bacterium]